jgi:hypothetical protein
MSQGQVPTPDEWDFRGLEPSHADFALEYELARERPNLTTFLALLTPEHRKEIEALRASDWEWNGRRPSWMDQEPFFRVGHFLRLLWCCAEFPKPWMALSTSARNRAVERNGPPRQPLRILTKEEVQSREFFEKSVASLLQSGTISLSSPPAQLRIGRYVIEIDWERADDAVLKPLLLKLLQLRPPGIGPTKRYTGKRAARGFYKFKQLAAWRLSSRGGFRYKDAWDLIKQRRKEVPKESRFELLPAYNSPGSWKDAVDAGARLVKRGF